MTKSRSLTVGLTCVFALASGWGFADPVKFQPLNPPVGAGALEPSLFAMSDGRIAMSWMEPDGGGFAVKMAIGNRENWGVARTITRSDKLFVNWADFPSVAEFSDGTFAAHWLQESGDSAYAYDVNIALSHDEGATWSKPIVPHNDGTQSQHGFATLLPVGDSELVSVWLDARAYKTDLISDQPSDLPDAMQLRATTLTSDGALSEDVLLDAQTCTCCQTSAVVTANGSVLVAYRDRTDAEVRDISIVRRQDGLWSKPKLVHQDGWEISGCPVNGPAIAALGQTAVVAWFTAADDIPAVKVAFSQDDGVTFDTAVRVDLGEAAGRVDAVMLSEQTALVTWVEWKEEGEVIFACSISVASTCNDPQVISVNTGAGSVNFPQMVRASDGLYFAWTSPSNDRSTGSERDTIKLMYSPL